MYNIWLQLVLPLTLVMTVFLVMIFH